MMPSAGSAAVAANARWGGVVHRPPTRATATMRTWEEVGLNASAVPPLAASSNDDDDDDDNDDEEEWSRFWGVPHHHSLFCMCLSSVFFLHPSVVISLNKSLTNKET